MGRTGLNFAVCTLLLAYLALSMTWCPLTVEARIPQFSAIKENLDLQSLARRSLQKDPRPSSSTPHPNATPHQHG
ncbi:hypothetical protein QUC31_004203 [Theobroma cacao]